MQTIKRSFFYLLIRAMTLYQQTYLHKAVLLISKIQLLAQIFILYSQILSRDDPTAEFSPTVLFLSKLFLFSELFDFKTSWENGFTMFIILQIYHWLLVGTICYFILKNSFETFNYGKYIGIWILISVQSLAFPINNFNIRIVFSVFQESHGTLVQIFLSIFSILTILTNIFLGYISLNFEFWPIKRGFIKTTKLLLEEFLWKSIFFIILMFSDSSVIRDWFLIGVNFFLAIVREYVYFNIIPYYSEEFLKYELVLNSFTLSASFLLCFGFLISSLKAYLLIIWTIYALLFSKSILNHLQNILSKIMSSQNESNPNYILYKIRAIRELDASNTLPTVKNLKIDQKYFIYTSYCLGSLYTEHIISKGSEKFSQNLGLRIEKIKLLIRKKQFLKAFELLNNSKFFEKSNIWMEASLNFIKVSLKQKIQKINSERGESNWVNQYIESSRSFKPILSQMINQTRLQVKFWKDFLGNEPEFLGLFNATNQISLMKRKLQTQFEKLAERKALSSENLPFIYLYMSLINGQPALCEKFCSQFKAYKSNQNTRDSNIDIDDDQNSGVITISCIKETLGIITGFSREVLDLFKYTKVELKNLHFSYLFGDAYKDEFRQDLQNFFEIGKSNFINQSLRELCVRKDNSAFNAKVESEFRFSFSEGPSVLMKITKIGDTIDAILFDSKKKVMINSPREKGIQGQMSLQDSNIQIALDETTSSNKDSFDWPCENVKILKLNHPQAQNYYCQNLKRDMFPDDFPLEDEQKNIKVIEILKLPATDYNSSPIPKTSTFTKTKKKSTIFNIHSTTYSSSSSKMHYRRLLEIEINSFYHKKSQLAIFGLIIILVLSSLLLFIVQGVLSLSKISEIQGISQSIQLAYQRENSLLILGRWTRVLMQSKNLSSISKISIQNVQNNSELLYAENVEFQNSLVGIAGPTILEIQQQEVSLVDIQPNHELTPGLTLDVDITLGLFIERYDTIFKNITLEYDLGFPNGWWIMSNIYNDIFIDYQSAVVLLSEYFTSTVNLVLQIVRDFAIGGFVLAVLIVFIDIYLCYEINTATLKLCQALSHLSEKNAHEILAQLELLQKKFETQNLDMTSFQSQEQLQVKYRTEAKNFRRNFSLKAYRQSLIKLFFTMMPIILLNISVFVAFEQIYSQNLNLISGQEDRMSFSAQSIISANLIASELTEITTDPNSTIRNTETNSEFLIDLQTFSNMDTLQSEYFSGSTDTRVVELLNNVSCYDPIFLVDGVNYTSTCIYSSKGLAYTGGIQLLANEYQLASIYGQQALESVNSENVFTEIQKDIYTNAKIINIVMGALWTLISNELMSFINTKQNQTLAALIGLAVCYVVLVGILLPNTFRVMYVRYDMLKRMLSLIPSDTILSNRWLRTYLSHIQVNKSLKL